MRAIAWDLETIQDKKAIPFIPEKGPKDRTEPWDKCKFHPSYTMPCVASFCDENGSSSIGLDTRSEELLLAEIWDILARYDRIVTFNGLSFDGPMLLQRSWYNNVKPTFTLSLRKYDLLSNHLDLRMILGNWDSYARGDLNLYCGLKLGTCKPNGMDGSKVQEMWDKGDYAAVHEYGRADAENTWKLYQSMLGYYLF